MHPLKAYRDAHDLTQVEAAKQFRITQSFLSLIEAGKAFARPAVAQRIAKRTGIDWVVLMNVTDNVPGRARQKRRVKSSGFSRDTF